MNPEGSLPCSLVPILNQMHPVHTLPPSFPKIHSNMISSSMPTSSKWSPPLRFPNQINVCISHLSHACYMTRTSHMPWFDRPNMWWSLQIMKLHEDVLEQWKDSATDAGERSASRSGPCTPGEKFFSTHWQEAGWAIEPVWMRWKRKCLPCSCQKSKPGRPTRSLVTVLTELLRLAPLLQIFLEGIHVHPNEFNVP
jgi:hypothetical protein